MARPQLVMVLVDHATINASKIDLARMQDSTAMACLWQTRGPINHAMGTVDELDVAGIKESATMESLQPVIGLIDYTMGDVNSIFV